MTISQTVFRAAMMDAAIDVPEGLLDGQGNPAGRRFSVYRNNVAVSLTESLETGFPVIAKLLGDANFKPIAGIYLRQSPPQAPVMMHYGADFPNFLRTFEPIKHLAYLGDVAEIELALRRAYHAADATPIAPDALAQIAPERLPAVTFTFAPAMEIVPSQWPIYDLWAYNMIEGAPKPQAIAQDVIVLRAEFDPEPHPLPPGGAAFLTAMIQGATLGDAAERATEIAEDFDLGALLGLLLSNAAITKITYEEQQ
ncbi:DNA-binding domain-containing protein [Cognatishimia sp. 1_MG-2023]|uniref:HvfC/BufC N-terminal domain-containing protein n=1 Tax=Cognatishimia sp. 1_MG-2023 TaxID=3062642 RepID=UPI0026E2D776|nr:DNA-binding domain-containing protein [Cognatishimia sp. 1_MG-2023]MDO6726441.1 DNA-binding domain-containing protein [Cognatishimia sp. 1_MG-2023]